MSDEFPETIEQDTLSPGGQDDSLPTYEDLSAQSGPNSRFGRWRGWIEKRAAERYDDVTPEERARRRERGWGNEDMDPNVGRQASTASPMPVHQPHIPSHLQLQINTDFEGQSTFPLAPEPPPTPPLSPLPFVSQILTPTHLKLNHFGSRFLPHATAPIRCVLSLLSDKLLLIGHDNGLSVLDLFPQEWTEAGGIAVKGPDEAQARPIWEGEGEQHCCHSQGATILKVHSMSLLEVEDTGGNTPQGVVLILVGPGTSSPSTKDTDSMKALRMYNLGSLTSLAKWTVAQKGCSPLDLRRHAGWNGTGNTPKKHRPQNSITRSIKHFALNTHPQEPATSSYHTLLSPSSSSGGLGGSNPGSQTRRTPASGSSSPLRTSSSESWDMVDDLPYRWATDFVPLASSGSRLLNSSITSYALWRDENRKGKGGQFLAVATKSTIVLYETPKGERAFRYVKEFYTPMQPRNIAFFQQAVHEVTRSASDVGARHHTHVRSDSTHTLRASDYSSPDRASKLTSAYSTQLSIFVVFDKKAGWIRLADSAVGEIDMYEDSPYLHSNPQMHHAIPRESLSPSASRRSRISFDGFAGQMKWTTPVRCELPIISTNGPTTKLVYLLTKGKLTHILPHPLPTNTSTLPPMAVFVWQSPPTSVTPRICQPQTEGGDLLPPYLQLVSLGERGLEVLETSLSFLSRGKGKERASDLVRASEDIGGPTGFLCPGGHWDYPDYPYRPPPLARSISTSSAVSADSFDSLESVEMNRRLAKQQGIYAWCCKGAEDYRVFWVGGSHTDI